MTAKHRSDYQIKKSMLAGAKVRAEAKGLPFNITDRDIVIPQFCPVLGLELKREEGPMTDASPTLDKIEPDKGYVRGNVVVISARANRLKSDASVDEIVRLASFYQQLVQ